MSQFPGYTGGYSIPGMNTVLEGVENHPWWGKHDQQIWISEAISGATRDAGNTVTTLLRPGLLMGRVTSSGLLKEWNPTGTDGSETIVGVLGGIIHSQQNGTNQDRFVGFIQVGGNLLSDRLIVPGNAAEGIVGDAYEFAVLQQLGRRFLFDRHYHMQALGSFGARQRFLTAAEITADAVTVSTADHGKTFVMNSADGNTTFTLPAAKVGLQFTFAANVATHNMVIALASGTLSKPGDSAGTGVTLGPGESATIVGVAAGQYQLFAHEATD